MIDRINAALKIAAVASRTLFFGVRNEHELRRYLQMTAGISVMTGPFQGMRYLETSHGSAWAPKVLGTYECELHDVITSLDLRSYRRLVDIGCAEGYYLVGLALMARQQGASLEAHGYDLNPKAVDAANWLCQINAVHGRAHHQRYDFDHAVDEPTLFVVDIEGEETELLTRSSIARHVASTFLVEVHEPPGLRQHLEMLHEVFQPTHDVRVIQRRERGPADFPSAGRIPVSRAGRAQLMNEFREKGNTWIIATRRGSTSGTRASSQGYGTRAHAG